MTGKKTGEYICIKKKKMTVKKMSLRHLNAKKMFDIDYTLL